MSEWVSRSFGLQSSSVAWSLRACSAQGEKGENLTGFNCSAFEWVVLFLSHGHWPGIFPTPRPTFIQLPSAWSLQKIPKCLQMSQSVPIYAWIKPQSTQSTYYQFAVWIFSQLSVRQGWDCLLIFVLQPSSTLSNFQPPASKIFRRFNCPADTGR